MEPATPSAQPDAESGHHIDLTIPSRPEYVAVVRLAAAGIAGRMAFSFDDVEDLKIAVGEACTAAILAGSPQVQIRFAVAPDRLDVRVAYTPQGAAGEEERELGMLLIRCLMDEVRTDTEGAHHVIWLTKGLQR